MPGLFQGIEIGRRALLANQLTLQTIGHNIANVNTPGYTRQRVTITTTLPENNAVGIIGTGVTVSDIRHIRDLFLGQQYREENKSLGQWSYKEKILSQLEALFNEPNDNTLSDLMNSFWDSWSDLSTNPSSTSTRSEILEQARLLTNGFHEMANQLQKQRSAIDADIANITQEINRLTGEIARINQQVKRLELGSSKANDLRDARDLLVDELSSLIDANTVEQPNGELTVYIGAMSIVNGSESIQVNSRVENVNGQITHRLVWENTDIELKNATGQLRGLIDARDEIVPRYLSQLNTLARSLVEQVNAIHASGYGLNGTTGVNFFDPTRVEAINISISSEIDSDVSRIASSGSGEVGDNTIALAIHDLRNTGVMNNDSTTLNDFYNSLVGALGVESHEAQAFTSNYDLLLQQVEFARQSTQGVSLDEEMTNVVKYQHAYDAAARVITAMDQALDTVISGMGIVGR